jgi:CspA family cold shock protein
MSYNNEIVTKSQVLMGCVKWFNIKDGYGFITVIDGRNIGTDVFVHHSNIIVENQQYKYLVQGEYVEFKLLKTSSGKHEYQAGDVRGIKRGKLMCETRFYMKQHVTNESGMSKINNEDENGYSLVRSSYKKTLLKDDVKSKPFKNRIKIE